jgi:hypothetical protein
MTTEQILCHKITPVRLWVSSDKNTSSAFDMQDLLIREAIVGFFTLYT